MQVINATDARKEWSSVMDTVIRERPAFIKRVRDCVVLTDARILEIMLDAYEFTAAEFIEDDGSVTLSVNNLDIAENGSTQQEALARTSSAILDYAEDFYNDFSYWARGARKAHIPYVIKALLLGNAGRIGEVIKLCRHGEI